MNRKLLTGLLMIGVPLSALIVWGTTYYYETTLKLVAFFAGILYLATAFVLVLEGFSEE